MSSGSDLLGREVRATPEDRRIGNVADLLLDLASRRAVALVVQPASAEPDLTVHSATAIQTASSSQVAAEIDGALLPSGPIAVGQSRLAPVGDYELQHPQLRRLTRLAAKLPIFDEAGEEVANLWDVDLSDDGRIVGLFFRVPRPTTAGYRHFRVQAGEIAAIDEHGVLARI